MAGGKDLRFTLLKKKPLFLRLDIIPGYVTSYLMYEYVGTRIFDQEDIFAASMLVLFIMFHSVLVLLNFWSNKLKARIGFQPAVSIEDATHVLCHIFFKKAHAERIYITEVWTCQYLNNLQFNPLSGKKFIGDEYDPLKDDSNFAIDLNKKRMFWDDNKKTFLPAVFPTHDSFGSYKAQRGYDTKSERFVDSVNTHGGNNFDIPIPVFFDVFKEHLVAPFFIF
jgi:hypothetical protein